MQFRDVRMQVLPSQMFKISTLQDNKKTNYVTKVYSNDWYNFFFDVLLTVHLCIILGIDQPNAQILVL